MSPTSMRRPVDAAGGQPVVAAENLSIVTPTGRTLLRGLDVTMHADRVALVGRNGVGKSTLLRVLAGHEAPHQGVVQRTRDFRLVEQELPAYRGNSRGQERRRRLELARRAGPRLLLLDEPTEDLDVEGIDWLCEWLAGYPGALLVASHHRGLLERFRSFFVIDEAGCRAFEGSFAELERDLEQREQAHALRYRRQLDDLRASERQDETIRRRRRRKKNLGRLHEERRATSRARLHGKKGYAQQSQARATKIRDARIAADRNAARQSRRALAVKLPLSLAMPSLPDPASAAAAVSWRGVNIERGGRLLVKGLDLELARDRLGVVGPNGAGKSSLLDALRMGPIRQTGQRSITGLSGIAQGASDWCLDDSLIERLAIIPHIVSADAAAELVSAHRFPLGLALRPMRSLSPGERVRAALIALTQSAPEMLVLDEPTFSLDFAGAAALASSLRAWPGGLVVASHDRGFLAAAGIERLLVLDGQGSHRFERGRGPTM
jgi:ATPase subunit of ABC transporter with duplicated ATPase domains